MSDQQQLAAELRRRNDSLEDQVQLRTGMIQMLHDIASHLHEAVSLEEAVNFTLRRVAEFNGWSFGHAFQVSVEDLDQLVPLRAYYDHSGDVFRKFLDATAQSVVRIGEGLPGRVLATGAPVWAKNLPEDLRRERAEVIDDLPIESAAAFPVAIDGRVELVLEFFGTHRIVEDQRIRQGMESVAVHLARTIERLRAVALLRESEQRFRELAESINQVFWIIDPSTDELIYVSPEWSRILGGTQGERGASGKPWPTRLHPDDRDWVEDEFRVKSRHGQFDVVYRVLHDDGEIRWVHDVAIPVHDEAGNVRRLIGVAEDITERRSLEREIADAATREQQRLSRDLHDSIGQELTGLTMMADRHAKALADVDPTEAEAARGLVAGLKRTLQQVRRISRGLAPVNIEAGGLTVALAQLCEQTRLAGATDCVFRCESPVRLDNPSVATHLYQIVQEAVANAVKHAHAERITVRLSSSNSEIELAIEDNGCGGARELRRRDSGMGLKIMRYRADLVGAKLSIHSEADAGTRIICRVVQRDIE